MNKSKVDPLARLTARPLRGVDELPEVCRLYEMAGWGLFPVETMERMFFKGPHGPALIMVLADNETNRLMGMLAFTPHRVQIGDTQEIASRGRSAILDPTLRRSATGKQIVDGSDPLQIMLNASWSHRLDRGWRISFSLPNPLFRKRNFGRVPDPVRLSSTFDLGYGLRIKLGESSRSVDSIVAVSADTIAGPEFDDLWERARQNLNIQNAVVRDAQGQRGQASHLRLELRHPNTGALRGYMRLKPDKGGRLEDILAEDVETFDELIEGSLAWLNTNSQKHSMRKVVVTSSPNIRGQFASVRSNRKGLFLYVPRPLS